MAKGRSSLLDSLLKSSTAELRFLDDNGKGDDMVAVAAAFRDMVDKFCTQLAAHNN